MALAVSPAEIFRQTVLFPLRTYPLHPSNHPYLTEGILEKDWSWLTRSDVPFSLQSLYICAGTAGEVFVVLSFPIAILLLLFNLRSKRRNPPEAWNASVLLALTVALGAMALHRPNIVNLVFAFSGPLLACLGLPTPSVGFLGSARFKGILSVALVVLLGLPGIIQSLLLLKRPLNHFSFPGGQVSVVLQAEEPTVRMLSMFPERLLRKGQTVFCYDYSSLWYFLLDLDNPTPFDNFSAERYSPPLVARLLDILRRSPPDWIILDGRYGNPEADAVANWFIQSGYRVRARTANMVIASRPHDDGGRLPASSNGAPERK